MGEIFVDMIFDLLGILAIVQELHDYVIQRPDDVVTLSCCGMVPNMQ